MAYRQPTERRDRAQEPNVPSYLDEFLDQVEPLQSTIRSAFAEIQQLEDRIGTTVTDAQAAADEAVKRATSKVAIESVRRQYHEFIHLQASATEFAEKKVSLAQSAHEAVETVLEDLDKRLVDFEVQLRKEGRWPGASPLATARPTGKSVAPSTEKQTSAPQTQMVEASSTAATTRVAQKTRKRESVAANPATPRAAALAAARAAAAAAASSQLDRDGDTIMDSGHASDELDMEEMHHDAEAAEQAVPDGDLYCICRGPSAGEMVACEGKKCKIEWFHFACVGLKEAPKGVWYCPACSTDKRRKSVGRRKQQI